jgi:replicative DNA helicase
MSAQGIVTRGDNALRPDPALSPGDILGRVTHVERDGTRVAIPAASLRLRAVARKLRCQLFSLSQLIRSVV